MRTVRECGPIAACAAVLSTGCIDLPPSIETVLGGASPTGGMGGSGGMGGAPSTGGHGGTGGAAAGPQTICEPGSPATDCATIAQLALGDAHTCALGSDGYLRCWGSNLSGELGNVSLSAMTHHPPTVVDALSNVSQVAAGAEHTCAIANQLLYCWGGNGRGQLGLGDIDPRYTPELVPIGNVAYVSAVTRVTCAVTTDSRVLCWGTLLDGQPWDGQAYSPVPAEVDGLQDLTHIATIDTSIAYACAATADGLDVRCWGDNGYGFLGNGTTTDSAAAVPVHTDLATPTLSIAAEGQTCAVGGVPPSLQCWGNFVDLYGEIYTEPRNLPNVGPLGFREVRVGWRHICLVDESDDVSCMGQGFYGELGSLGGNGEAVLTPVSVLGNVRQLETGWQHSCAVLNDGEVRCWGRNHYGQVAHGETEHEIRIPATVSFP